MHSGCIAVANGTLAVYPPSEWKITYRAASVGWATSAMWLNATPSHVVSSFDQRVTQWMSSVCSVIGRFRNSAHPRLKGSETSPHTRKSQPVRSP